LIANDDLFVRIDAVTVLGGTDACSRPRAEGEHAIG